MHYWSMISRRTLKGALARNGVSYKRLAQLLEGMGERASDNAIAHRVSRGSFTFAFFLKVAKVAGIEELDLTFLGRITPPPSASQRPIARAGSSDAGLQCQLSLPWSLALPGARNDAEVREVSPVETSTPIEVVAGEVGKLLQGGPRPRRLEQHHIAVANRVRL